MNNLINKRLLITGDMFFIERHHLLITALRKHFGHIDTLPFPALRPSKRRLITDIRNGFPYFNYFTQRFERSLTHWAFEYKSKILQKRVEQLKPDMVLQLFGQACSVKTNDLPFAITLDFTTALSERIYPAKRFINKEGKRKWLEKEREAFERATLLFPWSNLVAQSLQTDYGVDPQKIIVVGSSGNLQDIFPPNKKFGSKRILFNGSEFYRKGGDILIEAFKKAYFVNSAIKLDIIGIDNGPNAENVFYNGSINQEKLKELFAECDIVVAPARCDPYPGFIVEAMQYGIPCIVSDKGGMPEIVDHEQNGIVLSDLSAHQLANAINNLLNNQTLLEKYSKAAQDKVRSTLNWDFVANNIKSALAAAS